MKHKLVAAKSLILFAALSSVANAQRNPGFSEPVEVPSRQQVPVDRKPLTFSSKAQYVLVPVIVNDKSEQAVKGLKKEDFILLENGKQQPISSSEEVITSTAPLQRKEGEEFSNVSETAGPVQAPRIIIIALDLINTPVLDQTYARRSIMKMLASAPDDGSLIELVTIHSKGITVIHPFTENPKSLLAAMRTLDTRFSGVESFKNPGMADEVRQALGATGKLSGANTGSIIPITANNFQRLMSFVSGTDGQYVTYQRDAAIAATLEAFGRVATSVESAPGRKSLIWVTAGYPFFVDSDTSEIFGGSSYIAYERTMQALDNANVAIYPVDARGLVGIQADDSNRYATGDVYGVENQVNQMARNHNNTLDTMRTIARMTGGRAFFNRNDIGNLVSEAMNDLAHYYVLSFPLNKSNTRAGWRKLEVKVKEGGYKVRARQGYFVTRATLDQFDKSEPDAESAVQSPFEFTSLPVKARWLGTPTSGKTGKIVTFELDLPGTAISPDQSQNQLSLDFRVAAINPAGESKGDVKQTIAGTLPPGGAEQLKKEGVKYKNSFELAPGEYTVHFVVRDNMTGKVGSVIAKLSVTG